MIAATLLRPLGGVNRGDARVVRAGGPPVAAEVAADRPQTAAAAPGLFAAAVLAFVNAWDELLIALTFMNRLEMRTIGVGITLYQGELAFPWPSISAALILATVPVSILIAVFQERVVGGLTAGGTKG